jgi:hypothetical protein
MQPGFKIGAECPAQHRGGRRLGGANRRTVSMAYSKLYTMPWCGARRKTKDGRRLTTSRPTSLHSCPTHEDSQSHSALVLKQCVVRSELDFNCLSGKAPPPCSPAGLEPKISASFGVPARRGSLAALSIVGKRVVSSCATPGQTGVCSKWLGYEVSVRVPVPFGLTMIPDFLAIRGFIHSRHF